MLGCTCMIHLGIQWPKIRCSRTYAQHQHGMLQILCPTFPIIFSCVPDIYAQHKRKYSCVPEPLAQHKTSHRSCDSGSTPKHFINHVLQGPHPTQPTFKYISSIIGLRPIYKTNNHFHMKWGLRPNIYKIKTSR